MYKHNFRMMRVFASVLMLSLLHSTLVMAQEDDAAAIVQSALEGAFSVCGETGRDLVCYGHGQVAVEAQVEAELFTFAQPGDTVAVTAVESLTTSALDTDAGQWGVALARIQANMPGSEPEQNVTLLLFGDAEVASASAPPPTIEVTSTGGINVRSGPSTNNAIVTGLTGGQVVSANGRNEAGDWLRILLEGDDGAEDQLAWVFAPLFTTDDDIQSLFVVEPDEPLERPFQAITLQTGMDDGDEGAPSSGLLVQAPESDRDAQLTVNSVRIVTDGTLYLQASPSEGLIVSVIDGEAVVEANGVTRKPVFGTRVVVPIWENLTVRDAPR